MKLLIECGIEILPEEHGGRLELFESFLGGPAVPAAHDIGASCGHPSEREPAERGDKKQGKAQRSEQCRTDKELALAAETDRFRGYEADVLTEAADVILLNPRNDRSPRRDVRPLLHSEGKRLRLHRDILSGIGVIIAVLYRLYGEISRAARNERELEFLGTGKRALGALVRNLGVIDLHVERETDLRSFEQGDIPASRDGDNQRVGLMRLELVLRESRAYAELADSAAERCRRSGRKRRDIYSHGLRGDFSAHGLDVVEEAVEDAARARLDTHVHKADKLRRLDGELPCLLRDEHIAAEHRRVVNLSVVVLAGELDVRRSLHLLTPESRE